MVYFCSKIGETCIQLFEALNLLGTTCSLVGHFFLRLIAHVVIGGFWRLGFTAMWTQVLFMWLLLIVTYFSLWTVSMLHIVKEWRHQIISKSVLIPEAVTFLLPRTLCPTDSIIGKPAGALSLHSKKFFTAVIAFYFRQKSTTLV